MAKKKFGISASVNKALTQTIEMAHAESSVLYNTEILIDRISLDSENPRKHKITLKDLTKGPSTKDPEYKIKHEEYNGLCRLSASIQKEGLLHPIVVVEDGDNFKLVAGERRFFATIIADKKVIEARVFKKKPTVLGLKTVQWIENHSRKNISLSDRLMNISSIIEAYQKENSEKMTAIRLSEVLSSSRQYAQYSVAILSNKNLMKMINNGSIATFTAARELSGCITEEEIYYKLNPSKSKSKDKSKVVGRKRERVSLGTTTVTSVVKTITDGILSMDQFKKHTDSFCEVDWTCLTESTKAFQKLVKIMERELGALA